ncbi:MAG: ATP-binding protein, partial [Saprospiraceae bacterium]
WFASANGIYRKHLSTGSLTTYQLDPRNVKSISSNWVNRMYQDPKGIMWFSTPAGLNKFDDKTETFTRYVMNANDSSSLAWNDISALYTDSKSNFWVGTYGGGLHLMDKTKGTFTRYQWNASDSTSLNGDIVTSILEGDTNDLWIGLWDTRGISRMDYTTKKCKRYLPGISVCSILKDKEGSIWVGASSNIYKYDKLKDTFSLYRVGDVPVSFNEMKSMLIDKKDNLWIFSISGVIRINEKKDQYIIYGKQNGFTAEDYPYTSANLMSNGQIKVGSNEGYYSFFPDRLKVPTGSQLLYISNFYINGESIQSGPHSELSTSLKDIKEIRLSHDQNVFSVTFTSIDYSPEESKLFFYTLENFDTDWKHADPNGQLYYFNIPPGTYKLRINSTNTLYGTWEEKDITIIISPPWWKSWWAYVLYTIAIIVLALSVHRYFKTQVIKAERERNRAHELAQAKEVEKAYHELKNTQAQLIQSEKMASLGELTAGIAHEIQNPLNFINNFADVNAELIDELNQGIANGNMEEVKSISYNIKENEQKIIFHGKRADSIVKGMLQHSRASSGKKEPTDINALADEYLRLAYHGLRAKDKTFNAGMKTTFDDNLGMVNIIPQDIGRVILNLITNAFYAVSERKKNAILHPGPLKGEEAFEPLVSVTTKLILPPLGGKGGEGIMAERATVELRVSDNGSGIPQSVLDKIFQPFFTTKPTGQGTGLGLSMSYDIVKAHGGELKVETKEGEGSEFIIQLPIV